MVLIVSFIFYSRPRPAVVALPRLDDLVDLFIRGGFWCLLSFEKLVNGMDEPPTDPILAAEPSQVAFGNFRQFHVLVFSEWHLHFMLSFLVVLHFTPRSFLICSAIWWSCSCV